MNFRTGTGLAVVFVLMTMMVCPAIAAIQSNNSKSNGHCSTEEPQDHEQTMQGCCDQSAVSVQKVHAPGEIAIPHVLACSIITNIQSAIAFEPVYLLFEKTGDHLSKLCTLRL